MSDRGGLLEEIRSIVRQELCLVLGESAGAVCGPKPEESHRVLSGDLKFFRLPEVLHMVSLQSLTGRLSMSHDGRYVDMYFRDGAVAYATGDARGEKEQLGSILVGMGRLTAGGLDAALKKSAETGGRLGKVLVEGALASLSDIRSALAKQTERSVYRAVAWGEGVFYFEICELPAFVEDIQLNIKVEGLILEGVRRVSEIRLFSEKIPSMDAVFTSPVYAPDELDGMGLKEDERRVLSLVDGKRDVTDMVRASGLGEFGLLRALYALYSAGIIKKAGVARKGGKTQYL